MMHGQTSPVRVDTDLHRLSRNVIEVCHARVVRVPCLLRAEDVVPFFKPLVQQ